MMTVRSFLLLLLYVSTVGLASSSADSRDSVLHLDNAQIAVHFESAFTPKQKEKLLFWLTETAHTISTLYGQFPVERSTIHLYSSASTHEPVPWGEVWKNGAYTINLHVNPGFSRERFLNDWTAPHEFSHLFHPYPGRGNSWFGEGLASYYQNILRVRYGSMSEQLAFQKLYNGFQRGVKNQQRTGLSLKEASLSMRKHHSYMHVYWGGAAYFLTIDVRLREASQGKSSLDTVWYQFKQCCLDPNTHWPLHQLIPKLDELSDTTLFSDEYERIIHTRTFPDYQRSFQKLGIRVNNHNVTLSKDGSTQALRHQLVTMPSR